MFQVKKLNNKLNHIAKWQYESSYPDELLPDSNELGLNGLDPTLNLDVLRPAPDDGFNNPCWDELPDDINLSQFLWVRHFNSSVICEGSKYSLHTVCASWFFQPTI